VRPVTEQAVTLVPSTGVDGDQFGENWIVTGLNESIRLVFDCVGLPCAKLRVLVDGESVTVGVKFCTLCM
jgi:hypothetical protein